MGRLFWSGLLLGAGVLAQVTPPTHALWYVSLGVTEWGHWLLIPLLLVWWPGWQASGAGRVAACLAVVAAVLVLTPVWKARSYARIVQSEVAKFAGAATVASSPEMPARPGPLVLRDLVSGVPIPSVDWRTQPYVKRGERELEMDVYTPPPAAPLVGGRERRPIVVVVHGGLADGPWQSGDRQEAVRFNQYLAGHGYAVLSIDYRLAGQAAYPAALEDVDAALTVARSMGGGGLYDPSRIVLMGRGGGGHVALMGAYTLGDASIRGVIALYPPTDLAGWAQTPGTRTLSDPVQWIRRFLNSGIEGTGAALYQAASPVTHAGRAVPTLLIHGARDPIVPVTQSDALATGLRSFQRSVLYLQLPWATHSCDINPHGPCGQATLYAVERFLAQVTQ